MKTYFKLLGLIQLILLPAVLFSQHLPSKGLYIPEVYIKPTIDIYTAAALSTTTGRTIQPWLIYSDRDNNKTYNAPGSRTGKKTIKFLEEFYVAEIKGNYLHIYKELDISAFPTISNKAIDYGWIHRDFVILSDHALINENTRIDKKAMILRRILLDEEAMNLSEEINFKSTPLLNTSTNYNAVEFEIYMVYKITSNAVLLGKSFKIEGGNEIDRTRTTPGWVPLNVVTFWDHRVCLEPNWMPTAVNERVEKGARPYIFSEARAALSYKTSKDPQEQYIYFTKDPGTKRNPGTVARFPIIKDENVYKIGASGRLPSAKLEPTPTSEFDIESLLASFELMKEQAKNFNVVFVIDGTKSMGHYYQPIANAIANSVRALSASRSKHKLKFAVVIYRDFLEGEHLTEIKRLTNDANDVINFLQNVRTDYDNDKDYPEAVCYGLKTALTSLGLTAKESNFIFLIGDAGNHQRKDKSYVAPDEVVKLLTDLHCNLLTFQVNNGTDPSYLAFNLLSSKLILETAKNLILKIGKSAWKGEVILETPYFLSGANKYYLYRQAIEGSFYFSDPGKVMETNQLQKDIEYLILDSDSAISIKIAAAENYLNIGEVTEIPECEECYTFDPKGLLFLESMGLKREQINEYQNRGLAFSVDAYAVSQTDWLKYPLFKPVLFLSQEDLYEMNLNMKKLVDKSSPGPKLRKNLQETYKTVLKNHIGKIDMTSTIKMLNDQLFGIPSTSEFLRDVRLQDITDERIVTDGQIRAYLDYMFQKYSDISKILNTTEYPYKFKSGDMNYYWIELDKMP